MDDFLSQVAVIRISELTCDNQGCRILHDNGLSFFKWDSILSLFLMLSRGQTVSEAIPDLFLFDKNEKILYYIDGNRFNFRKFFKKDITSEGEKNLSMLIKRMLPFVKGIYLDETLDDFLEGELEEIPSYSGSEEIWEYLKIVTAKAEASESQRIQKQKWSGRDEGIAVKEWDVGDLIDENLRVKDVLKGGMGVVYIVNDISTSRLYALKTIQRQFFWDRKTYDMFIREAELWVRLEKHPNIVQAHFVKIHGGYPFIYLEYVKGTNLDREMERGPLSINITLDYAIQFCRGMDYAYKKLGIVHRDIKPSNCLITENEILKISDFGLAGIFSEPGVVRDDTPLLLQDTDRLRVGSTGAFQGTLPYMAPERFKNMRYYDICSDIYSFGVMLHEMLTGRQPLVGSDFAEFMIMHNKGEVPHIKSIHPVLPDELAHIVMKCLAKDPRERYQNFGELELDLKYFYRSFMRVEYTTKELEEDLRPDEWVNKGLSLATLGQYEEALKCYDQAIKKDHRMAGAWLSKGNGLFALERYKEALVCYNRVLEVDPLNEESWIKKGFSFFKLKRFQDALSCYNEAIGINNESEEAWIKKGLYYAYLKNLSEGLKCYDQALRINERSSDALFYKGILLMEQGEKLEAISLFDKVLDINPRWVDVWLKKADVLMGQGLFDDAISAYSRVLEIDADNIYALLGKARCFILVGEPVSAHAVLSLIIEKKPSQREALFLLYKVCFYLGRMEASLEACQKLLDQEPERVEVILAKGNILESLFEFEESLDCYRKALKLSPENPDAQFHIKSLEFRSQIFNDCVESLLKREVGFPKGITSARLLVPIEEKKEFLESLKGGERPSPDKLFMMGVNAYQDRTLWQAAQYIMESLNEKPDNPQAWLWSGKILEELEFFDNALDSYGQYLKLIPDAANVWLEVGNLYKKKKRVDKVIDCLIQALKVDSRNWKFFLLLISYLQNMGGWGWAAGIAMKALKLMRTYYLDMEIREKKYEALFDVVLTRYERANTLFNEILSTTPKDIFFTCHKGDNYVRLNLENDASNIFFKASRFGKRSPFFLYYLAIFNQFTLNEETALKYFQLVSKKDPHLSEAVIQRAIILYKQRDYAGALQCMNILLHYDLCINRAREVKSIVLVAQSRFREALSCIDEGLNINPWDAGLLYNKIVILRMLDEDVDHIYKYLELFRKYHPLEVTPWNMQASFLLEEGNFDEAESYCEKALLINSLSAHAWNNRGALYAYCSEIEKAIKCFSMALELDQNNVEARNNRGCLFLQQGKIIEAGIDFNRLHRIDRNFPWGCYNRALYLCMKGSYDQSLKELERAEALLEGMKDLHLEKAVCYFMLGDRNRADVSLIDSVRTNPDNTRLWFLKALMSTALGEYEESLQFYDHVLRKDENFSLAWLCMGISLNACEQKEKGAKAIKKANEINSQNLWDHLKDTISPEEIKSFMLSTLSEPFIVPTRFKPSFSSPINFLVREIEFFF